MTKAKVNMTDTADLESQCETDSNQIERLQAEIESLKAAQDLELKEAFEAARDCVFDGTESYPDVQEGWYMKCMSSVNKFKPAFETYEDYKQSK